LNVSALAREKIKEKNKERQIQKRLEEQLDIYKSNSIYIKLD
jgi:hypothetical protein